MANFESFWQKWAKREFFSKKRLEKFLCAYGFRKTALRTNERTNECDSLGLKRLRRETKKSDKRSNDSRPMARMTFVFNYSVFRIL